MVVDLFLHLPSLMRYSICADDQGNAAELSFTSLGHGLEEITRLHKIHLTQLALSADFSLHSASSVPTATLHAAVQQKRPATSRDTP